MSCAAKSRFVPHSNSTLMVEKPSLDDEETFFTWLTLEMVRSRGSVTRRSISWGATPEYWVTTVIIGKEMSGIISSGSRENESRPNTITIKISMVMVTRLLTENATRGLI